MVDVASIRNPENVCVPVRRPLSAMSQAVWRQFRGILLSLSRSLLLLFLALAWDLFQYISRCDERSSSYSPGQKKESSRGKKISRLLLLLVLTGIFYLIVELSFVVTERNAYGFTKESVLRNIDQVVPSIWVGKIQFFDCCGPLCSNQRAEVSIASGAGRLWSIYNQSIIALNLPILPIQNVPEKHNLNLTVPHSVLEKVCRKFRH